MNGSATVVIADDEPTVTDMYARQLRDRYAVRRAYSGEEALSALDEAVDAALLDRRTRGCPATRSSGGSARKTSTAG